MVVGFALGTLAGANERANAVLFAGVDVLQTLPMFVNLIPVVMLFSIGDFPAFQAIMIYAVAPAIRYTTNGLRGMKPSLIEGAKMSGCTSARVLWQVKLPLALPKGDSKSAAALNACSTGQLIGSGTQRRRVAKAQSPPARAPPRSTGPAPRTGPKVRRHPLPGPRCRDGISRHRRPRCQTDRGNALRRRRPPTPAGRDPPCSCETVPRRRSRPDIRPGPPDRRSDSCARLRSPTRPPALGPSPRCARQCDTMPVAHEQPGQPRPEYAGSAEQQHLHRSSLA